MDISPNLPSDPSLSAETLAINISSLMISTTSISLISGYISLTFWLFAQLPQVLENYKNHSVEGVAPGFLISWIVGDISNFVGCILTNALPFQILLSGYYCSIDFILTTQFIYYTKIYPKLNRYRQSSRRLQKLSSSEILVENNESFPSEHIITHPTSKPIAIGINSNQSTADGGSSGGLKSLIPSASFSNMVTGSFLASFGKVRGLPINNNNNVEISIFNSFVSTFSLDSHTIGLIFAWFCTSCYLTARLPQLYKNYKRKSTEGLSMFLFFFALNGNLYYTISILTCDEFALARNGTERWDFFMKELPYIMGSAGTIIFDIFALYQSRIYKDNHPNHHNHNVDQSNTSRVIITTGAENHETKLYHHLPYYHDTFNNSNEDLLVDSHPLLQHHRNGSTSSVSIAQAVNQPLVSPSNASNHLKTLLSINPNDYSPTGYGSTSSSTTSGIIGTNSEGFKSNRPSSSTFNTPLTPWDLLDLNDSNNKIKFIDESNNNPILIKKKSVIRNQPIGMLSRSLKSNN